MSYEEFAKSGASKVEKGTHEVVDAHYSGEEKGDAGVATIETRKDNEIKGDGKAEHTEEVKAADLSDPKIQPKTI